MSNKRLNYFRSQFLQEEDFKDEQKYHMESHRLHNKNLHTWGIINGLEVTIGEDKKTLNISKGMAIDKAGRQIVLEKDRKEDVYMTSEQSFYLIVRYGDEETTPDERTGNKTRVEEKPYFDQQISKPEEASEAIILAKVTMNQETELIEKIEIGNRKKGGVGQDQIEEKSVSITQMNHHFIEGGPRSIDAGKEEEADTITTTLHKDPSQNHQFFFTSVIPTTRDSSIEWRWQARNNGNEIKYELWVKNTSKKPAAYLYRIYQIYEKSIK